MNCIYQETWYNRRSEKGGICVPKKKKKYPLTYFLRGYARQSILAPLFKLLEALFDLFVPLVVAEIIDVGIAGNDIPFILRCCALLVALGVVGLVCSITAQWFAAQAAIACATSMRHTLYQHIQTLDFSQVDALGGSTLITRLTSDINQVQNGLNMALRLFMRSPFIVLGSVVLAFTIDWKPLDKYDKDAPKTMNAHLHVLEAYMLLYQCRPDPLLRERLEYCTRLFMNTLYNPQRKHFNAYLDNAWHSLVDIDSYGHDVEAGWLLCRAVDALGNPQLQERARRIAVDVTRTCLDEALTPEGYLRYERTGDRKTDHCSWWGQDEAIIACVNAWQISGDKQFLREARRIWDFVMRTMKDREFGEWFSDCNNGIPIVNAPKANMWRCPYHTTRLGVEMQKIIN